MKNNTLSVSTSDILNSIIFTINDRLKYLNENLNDRTIREFDNNLIDHISQINALKISISTSSEMQLRSLEELVHKYQNTLQKIELDTNALSFQETVAKYDKIILSWKLGIFLSALILILVSVYFLFFDSSSSFSTIDYFYRNLPKEEKSKEVFQVLIYFELVKKIILRVLILSIVIYILKFVVKNYNAIMHIRTNNQHKANTLDAAVRILNISDEENEEVRTQILMLAGREIFSSYKTGYLNKENSIEATLVEKLADVVKK